MYLWSILRLKKYFRREIVEKIDFFDSKRFTETFDQYIFSKKNVKFLAENMYIGENRRK
jgi:hypothetical protein